MHFVARRAAVGAAIVAIAGIGTTTVAATKMPFGGHTSTLNTLSLSGTVSIDNAPGRTGTVRERIIVPRTWKRTSSLNTRVARFNTNNSCRHKVTFRPRLIQAPDVPATERAAALTPAPATNVRTSGTRGSAAFRVIRQRGTADVTGVLVQPLSSRYAGAPAGQRIYAEIVAVGLADPRTECHSGGPRGVGDAFGDAFAISGAAGGFVMP